MYHIGINFIGPMSSTSSPLYQITSGNLNGQRLCSQMRQSLQFQHSRRQECYILDSIGNPAGGQTNDEVWRALATQALQQWKDVNTKQYRFRRKTKTAAPGPLMPTKKLTRVVLASSFVELPPVKGRCKQMQSSEGQPLLIQAADLPQAKRLIPTQLHGANVFQSTQQQPGHIIPNTYTVYLFRAEMWLFHQARLCSFIDHIKHYESSMNARHWCLLR